jgi:hypothetical protein
MFKVWETDNRKLALHITITCKGKRTFRCASSDYHKVNSKYSDRTIEVDGTRTIFFSFPVTPKQIIIGVQDLNDKNFNDFEVTIEEKPLVTYGVWLDEQTRDFLQMALTFSQTCGFESADAKGRLITSKDKEFKIKYFPVIKDYLSGTVLNTPARIGHNTGIIEVSKRKFDCYTIPMRMIILLHEFSHKYKNPTLGLEVSNEIGADINALYIYLGLGFSKIDAIHVFANVFLKAQTDGNIQRMRKIVDYIDKFCNEEFAKKLI